MEQHEGLIHQDESEPEIYPAGTQKCRCHHYLRDHATPAPGNRPRPCLIETCDCSHFRRILDDITTIDDLDT